MMKNKKIKKCTSKIQELITAEQLVSLCNLKAEIERKENRRNRRKERENTCRQNNKSVWEGSGGNHTGVKNGF